MNSLTAELIQGMTDAGKYVYWAAHQFIESECNYDDYCVNCFIGVEAA